ncbi:MAG: hypothetical protein K940chlam3_01203 [Chlamydiae bacterium]|nr:hypothetical protein [Chlamydiota bacterium]
MKWFFLIIFLFFAPLHSNLLEKRTYDLRDDPIDVVIPCVAKDLEILELCIQGAKDNIQNIRRIIVVSPQKYTDNAEWYDEQQYPFSMLDIAKELIENESAAVEYYQNGGRVGWYFQQLLKIYTPLIIPGISTNVLVLDADTVFLRPVKFLNDRNGGLYSTGSEYHRPYFAHMKKLVPGLVKVYPQCSGICHHMLFQKDVILELIRIIEEHHQKDAWKAFCNLVDPSMLFHSGMAEYEIYFNFIFTTSDQMEIRPLKFCNVSSLSDVLYWKRMGYDFVSCHHYLRK